MAVKNAPATKSAREIVADSMKEEVKKIIPYLDHILPKGYVPRFVRMTHLALIRDPKLYECSITSFLLAIIWCAQKGLEPGVEDGAWLIPFKGKVVPVPGYKGLINKAVETKAATSVDPVAVFENDEFYYERGLEEELKHRPPKLGEPRGEFVGAYVVIRLPNGEKKFEVMDRAEIEKIRDNSAAWKSKPNEGPWHDWFERMALKTVIKRGLKTVPMSPELRDLLIEDGKFEAGATVGAILQGVGEEIPEGVQEMAQIEEAAGEALPEQKKGPDTSAFDLLVAKKLEGMDAAGAQLRREHLKENLKVSAKNMKKTVDQFKEFAANYFEPFEQKGQQKDGYWKTFLAWEQEHFPAQGEQEGDEAPPTDAGLEGEPPGDEGPQPIFSERKKALMMKILSSSIPMADMGVASPDEITPENIADIEARANAWQPKKKK